MNTWSIKWTTKLCMVLVVKNLPTNAGDRRDTGLIPGLGRSPGGGHDNPLQYSCLENPHGQRSLVGYSPWGHKESDMTEKLSIAQHKLYEHYTNSYTFLFHHWRTMMVNSIKTQIIITKIFYFKCQTFKQNFQYHSQQYQEWMNQHLKHLLWLHELDEKHWTNDAIKIFFYLK